jgi:hypothetical protein
MKKLPWSQTPPLKWKFEIPPLLASKQPYFPLTYSLPLLCFFNTFFSFHRHWHRTTNNSTSIQRPSATNVG